MSTKARFEGNEPEQEDIGFDDEGFAHDAEAEDAPEGTPEDEFVSLDEVRSREADGVGALHDVEAEAGDETELDDLFDLDENEARDLGADFAGDQRDEPRLG